MALPWKILLFILERLHLAVRIKRLYVGWQEVKIFYCPSCAEALTARPFDHLLFMQDYTPEDRKMSLCIPRWIWTSQSSIFPGRPLIRRVILLSFRLVWTEKQFQQIYEEVHPWHPVQKRPPVRPTKKAKEYWSEYLEDL